MGRSTITHLVIIQAIALGVIAFIGSAGAVDHDRSPSAYNDMRNDSKIDVRGTLKCPMPEANTGRSCTLELVNNDTGKDLRIVASNAAMRLFQDGQTQVVATGTLMGDALRIIEIRAQ
jgi:hypothetical protein